MKMIRSKHSESLPDKLGLSSDQIEAVSGGKPEYSLGFSLTTPINTSTGQVTVTPGATFTIKW